MTEIVDFGQFKVTETEGFGQFSTALIVLRPV